MSIPELICGLGYIIDWEAISAVATAFAVLVALWIPIKDRRERKLEELKSHAAAARVVSLSLSSVIEIFPKVVEYIKRTNGILIDTPGKNVLYGIDACKEIIQHEVFIHKLPTEYVDIGIYTLVVARQWCSEIDVRLQLQLSEELRERIDWQNHEFTRALGEKVLNAAIDLRARCNKTWDYYNHR